MCIYMCICECVCKIFICPLQLFWMCCHSFWCFIPSRTDPGLLSTKCLQTCNMFCLPLRWNRWETRDTSPPHTHTCNYLSGCSSLTVKLFVSADLPTFLSGQVHYLQPCDTVRPTSVVFSFLSACLIIFTVTVFDRTAWTQPDLT